MLLRLQQPSNRLCSLGVQSDASGSVNPTVNLIDSVFVVEQVPDGDRRADFPPAGKINQRSGVTVIYLGEAVDESDYPGRLPPAGCYTFLNGAEGRNLWQTEVENWHAALTDVVPDRKDPGSIGDVTFPRPPFNSPEQ